MAARENIERPLDRDFSSRFCFRCGAGMAKRVDARDLKSLSRKGVRVRVPVLASCWSDSFQRPTSTAVHQVLRTFKTGAVPQHVLRSRAALGAEHADEHPHAPDPLTGMEDRTVPVNDPYKGNVTADGSEL